MSESKGVARKVELAGEYSLEGLDWTMEYEIGSGCDPVSDGLWESALTYDSGTIEEMFESSGSFYHSWVDWSEVDGFDMFVGISFKFAVEGDEIVATGLCHPAYEGVRGDYYTLSDEVIAERSIVLRPASDKTAAAMRAHIAAFWE